MASVLLFGLVACKNDTQGEDTATMPSDDTTNGTTAGSLPTGNGRIDGFIKAQGQLLVDEDGDQYLIKGISFSNDAGSESRTTPRTNMHDKESYAEVKSLGLNSVRFYLSYKFFEDDANPGVYKESAWEWLDQNIAWAKEYDIRLVLNMHTPQGGYQSVGEGLALWTDTANQDRLVALWKAIAERYKDEVTILGYGLVNEPIMPWKGNNADTIAQWKNLAQRITDEIRTVNTNHIIFVERAISARDMDNGNKAVALDANSKFVLVDDTNVVYEYHDYSPSMFTHQGMAWNDTLGKYADYPNDSKQFDRDSSLGTYVATAPGNPRADVKSSDWQYLEGNKDFHIGNAKNYSLGIVTILAENIGSNGVVYVDDITVKEYDENGELIKTISAYSFSQNTSFYYWASGGSGGSAVYDATQGHDAAGCIKISGAVSNSKTTDNFDMLYITKGHSYQISGWVKCENVNSSANIKLTIDYNKIDDPQPRNKDSLEKELLEYIEFGKKNNVPMYLGEFGTAVVSFENNLGGDRWVEDMMSLLVKHNVNFNYHTYNEIGGFGLWYEWDSIGNRKTRNEFLADAFKRFFASETE